jgi:hypothetical protein
MQFEEDSDARAVGATQRSATDGDSGGGTENLRRPGVLPQDRGEYDDQRGYGGNRPGA